MALAEVAGVESFVYVAGYVLEEILGINFITQGVCVCEYELGIIPVLWLDVVVVEVIHEGLTDVQDTHP